jgi:hypothetical protein
LNVEGEAVQAVFEEEHDDREFTTSVHYLKFPLTQSAKNLLLNEEVSVTLELNHPNLTAKVALPSNTVRNLQKDLF